MLIALDILEMIFLSNKKEVRIIFKDNGFHNLLHKYLHKVNSSILHMTQRQANMNVDIVSASTCNKSSLSKRKLGHDTERNAEDEMPENDILKYKERLLKRGHVLIKELRLLWTTETEGYDRFHVQMFQNENIL